MITELAVSGSRSLFLALGLLAMATPTRAADPPAQPPSGSAGAAVATAGQTLSRGSARPSRPRGEALLAAGPWDTSVSRLPAPFQAKPATISDTLTVVFFARPQPVRVQVLVRTTGKTLAQRWHESLRTLFQSVDRDGDGFLNRFEVDYIIPVHGVAQLLTGSYYLRAGDAPTLETLDLDADERVSFAEFSQYYQPVAADLIKARSMPLSATPTDTTTALLYQRLDLDQNGRLTQDELRKAERILLALDQNDDECLSANELTASPSPPMRAVMTARAMASPKDKSLTTANEVQVLAGPLPATLTSQLLSRYDTNQDKHLTPAEFAVESAVFKALDLSGDGKLTTEELDAWRNREPDAIVTLELGETPSTCQTRIRRPGDAPWPAGFEVRQAEPQRLVIRVGPQSVAFGTYFPPDATRKHVASLAAPVGVFGDRKEIQEEDLVGPQNQYLRVIFDAADFNADGRLTRTEFDRYFHIQRSTAELGLTLTSAVRTPNLFQLLDENRDGKLSVRELRTAWDRMIVLEPGQSEAVTSAILQPSVSLQLTPALYSGDLTAAGAGTGESGSIPRTGPLWFRKMDRNADGDVSLAEFLGSTEYFARLDTNKDSLISLAEAEAYEKIARPAPPKSTAKSPPKAATKKPDKK